MTPQERATLSEQLLNNPLFQEALDDLEHSAIERLVYEPENLLEAQLRVQAIRAFRSDLQEAVDTRKWKGALD